MKKKKTNIIKFISFLLLIFSFNLSVNAETTKIYYADSRGIRKPALTAPEGYPNNGGGAEVTLYSYRTVKNTYDPTKYYACSTDAKSTVVKYQQVPCGSEGSLDATLTYEKENFYSCAKTQSDIVFDLKIEQGKKCKEYSDWAAGSTEKPTGYNESNTELYKSATATWYFWYKEVNNATTIDFTNNKVLYDAIKSKISTTQIKNAEINYIEDENKGIYKILAADISKITFLNLRRNNIVDITQLGKFTGLTNLNLSTNKIVNIDSLKYLVNLEKLELYNNYIVSIEPIVGLKKLKLLDFYYNDITNLSLLKKIENYDSIEKDYRRNDYKKSGLIKNWSDFVREVTFASSPSYYSVSSTKDSMEFIYSGKTVAKFEYKNNILKLTSFSTVDYAEEVVLGLLRMSITHSESDKLIETCKKNDTKCYFSKFGDYLKLDVKYDENSNTIEKMDFSFDLRYFFGDNVPGKNPKTGVSNALVLLGITLLSSAIGFMVLFRHKTGIQL